MEEVFCGVRLRRLDVVDVIVMKFIPEVCASCAPEFSYAHGLAVLAVRNGPVRRNTCFCRAVGSMSVPEDHLNRRIENLVGSTLKLRVASTA